MASDPLDWVSPEVRAKLLAERQRLADLDQTTRDLQDGMSEAQRRKAQWEGLEALRVAARLRQPIP